MTTTKDAGERKEGRKERMVCGGCAAEYPFSTIAGVRHWEAWGREGKHSAFNFIIVDGSAEYYGRLEVGGQVPSKKVDTND